MQPKLTANKTTTQTVYQPELVWQTEHAQCQEFLSNIPTYYEQASKLIIVIDHTETKIFYRSHNYYVPRNLSAACGATVIINIAEVTRAWTVAIWTCTCSH